MYNKNNWQYKGLVSWVLFDEIGQRTTRDIITGHLYKTDSPQYNTNVVNVSLPNGKSGNIVYSIGHYYAFYNTDIKWKPTIINGVTVAFWMYASQNSFDNAKDVYSHGSDILVSTTTYGGSNGQFYVQLLSGYRHLYLDAGTLTPNSKWYHVVVAIDNDNIYLYVNGVLHDSSQLTNAISEWVSTYSSFQNGSDSNSMYIYDFRLYNYTWRAGHAAKYYNNIRERNALFTPERAFQYIDTIDTMTNSVPLAINGPLPLESGLPFHIFNSEPYNAGSDVYISGSPGLYDNSTTLYIKNSIDYNASVDVYISGREAYESTSTTMYTCGPLPMDSGIPFLINGPFPSESGMSWWMSGPLPKESGKSLYVKGHEPFLGQIDLYMFGSYIDSSGIPNFIHGYDTRESGVSFFTKGHIPISSGITAYMYGHDVHAEGMNMYTNAIGSPQSEGLDIFMWASSPGTAGIYNSTPMTVYNTVTTDPRNGIPFFITTPNGSYNEGINFVVGNVENRLNLGTTLYIDGPEGIITSGLPMYINTPVGTTGSVPFNGGMNLFINREVNSYATNTTLYLKTSEGLTNYSPMYINGANIITNSNPMYIEGSGLPVNQTLDISMFTRGR